MKFVILLVFAVVWSVQAIDWQEGDGGAVRWSHNCDIRGGDIGNEKGKAEDCGSMCLNHDGCKKFAWTDWEGGSCWFKNDGEPFDSNNGGVCGEVV